MTQMRRRQSGFTMIELLIVIIIIGILAAIATAAYAKQRSQAKTAACRADMRQIEVAEKSYIIAGGSASLNVQTLVDDHLLEGVPRCPAGGVYSWVSDVDGHVELSCSIHGAVSGGSTTPVASTFTATTGNLIELQLAYFAKYGRWPRSWAPYCYTDLGLDAAQYAAAIDHVYYKPVGSTLTAHPEAGYVMTVTDAFGKSLVLTSKLQWDLVYDATSGQWYYHTVDPANLIDINTLKTTPG